MAEENITSVLDKLQAENISLNDIIYLIQGFGINRDRYATLGQLLNSGVLSRIDVQTIELTAGTSIDVNKEYTLVMVDNNQNSGAGLSINAPSDQSYRGVVDVVVRWKDEQTEKISIAIGNGTYYLSPQNGEWGRFFIGAEGRVWSYQVSVTDHTIGEEFSGEGKHDNIPREWNVGKKGFSFKATNSGTPHEIKLDFVSNQWVLSGLGLFNGNSYFHGDVNIGTDVDPAQVQIRGKVSKTKYVLDENVVESDTAYSLYDFNSGSFEVGEVVFVYNTGSASINVMIEVGSYVTVKPKCTIGFRCAYKNGNVGKWSPLDNLDIETIP